MWWLKSQHQNSSLSYQRESGIQSAIAFQILAHLQILETANLLALL